MLRVLFILLAASLTALDRITVDDGSTVECTIISQSAESVTFEVNGEQRTLPKSDIKNIELDIDVDKFYNAAVNENDREKKKRYLKRSIELFPASKKNRELLAAIEQEEAAEAARQRESEAAQRRERNALLPFGIGAHINGGYGMGIGSMFVSTPFGGIGIDALFAVTRSVSVLAFFNYSLSVSGAEGTAYGIQYRAVTTAHTLSLGALALWHITSQWYAGGGLAYVQTVSASTAFVTNGSAFTITPDIVIGHAAVHAVGGFRFDLGIVSLPVELDIIVHITAPLTVDIVPKIGVLYRFGGVSVPGAAAAMTDDERIAAGIALAKQKRYREAIVQWEMIAPQSALYERAQANIEKAKKLPE